MSDGTLLLSLNGSSYTTYMKEEVDKYRIVISGKTCIFENENDPRILRSVLDIVGLCSPSLQECTHKPYIFHLPECGFDTIWVLSHLSLSLSLTLSLSLSHSHSLSLMFRTNSPGKLIRYMVEDGDHVDANTAYAEIEVMKMVTYVYTTRSGMWVT